MTVAQPGGVDAVVSQYAGYGPLVAAFLVNLLATVGDKGQLVVVTLASRYDARTVFLGAMGAFALWSALEVALGAWLVRALPGGLIAPLAGGLFLAFGLWTARSAYRRTGGGEASAPAPTGGGLDAGLTGRFLPDGLLRRVGTHGGVRASFAFVLVAEFGDKTQLLTIDLAATFPDAPLSVFVGVVAALGLRTGLDALVSERVERWLPTRAVEAAAAAVFLAFGLLVLGVLPATGLLVVLAVVVLGLLGWAVAAGR